MGGSIQTSIRSSTKGLIEKGQLDHRTNVYALTDRGKRELKARRDREDQYVSKVLKITAEDKQYVGSTGKGD